MKQAIMTAPGQIDIREVPMPRPQKGEILIRMERIGVCGSDIHVYHGKHPYTSYPVVQGHESAGSVELVGPDTHGFSPGEKVTIMPQVTCGSCIPCRSGRYNICENLKVMGFQTAGSASEYIAVDAANCIVFPTSMTYEEGAMIEPVAVAVHAVKRLGVAKTGKLTVFGAGPIGNLTAQSAKGLGAAEVLITDLSDYRLSVARECGIDHTVNTMREDPADAILRHFGPGRADGTLECVGVSQTMEQAIRTARKGTDIVIVGVFSSAANIDLGLVQDKELGLTGSLMYTKEDYLDAIRLIDSGAVKLKPLMSAHFPLDRYIDAYRFIEENRERTMKVFIDL